VSDLDGSSTKEEPPGAARLPGKRKPVQVSPGSHFSEAGARPVSLKRAAFKGGSL